MNNKYHLVGQLTTAEVDLLVLVSRRQDKYSRVRFRGNRRNQTFKRNVDAVISTLVLLVHEYILTGCKLVWFGSKLFRSVERTYDLKTTGQLKTAVNI